MTPPWRRAEDTPVYTIADLAEATGLSERTTRRFYRALGFPDARGEVRYSEADLTVLRQLTDAVNGSDVDLATAVRLVRAVGQNVARMSDWQMAAIAARAEELARAHAGQRSGEDPATRTGEEPLDQAPAPTREEQGDGSGDPTAAGGDADSGSSHGEPGRYDVALRLTEDVQRALQGVLIHSWRRHLTAALGRLDIGPEHAAGATTASVSVGFADLVNFSALSNELDSNRLGELVEIFEARCGDVVTAHDGRLIKTLGDSVLFVADDAERALGIAYGIIEVIGRDNRLPDVRLGLASGMVVVRMGDVFGPPVNLAARLTALARRNRVITDDATAAALRSSEYETLRLTARPLRGFGLVEPVAVRRR